MILLDWPIKNIESLQTSQKKEQKRENYPFQWPSKTSAI